MNLKHLLLTVLLLAGIILPATAQVEVAPMPEKDGPVLSARYDVSVRSMDSSSWQQVPVLRCDVNTRRVQQSAYAEFDMGCPVIVRVRSNEHDTYNPVIRPSARQIQTLRIDARTVEFALTEPAYLSLEQDGDREHNLHIFANSLLTERHTPDEPQTINWEAPNSQDVFIRNPRLIYFGPGVHRPKDLPGGDIKIPSNCTVYLAPGAVVKARLIVDHAENVRIVGRGILDHPLRGVEITYSKN
ncbi:MAG: glycoside hydrolase, partial [Bacteroidaceae bacterium]|nr:glycoside hydrolase [Bacteroidaceae bacterium]